MRIALISLPWLSPYRPSIQLGVLQAWLARELPEVEVDVFHDHLGVAGWMEYRWVKAVADGVHSSWIGEALSAYLLFPEQRNVIGQFLEWMVADKEPKVDIENDLLLPYGRFVRDRVRTVDWSKYDVVGLSVTLCQTLSSVLLARRIRAASPHPKLLFGGPALSGRVGESFLATFPEIDAIVQGEGELPLTALLRAQLKGDPWDGLPGVLTRTSPPGGGGGQELSGLGELPVPDYRAYFTTLAGLPDPAAVLPDVELPVEGARGCWWDRRHCKAGASCQFCNLNLQWKGYREKSIDRQLEELQELCRRHGLNRFLFVDNVTRRDPAVGEELFRRIAAELPGPRRIYLEARANLTPRQWEAMAAAGVGDCQVGIESLATSVLKKIGKGTTALQNLAAMKELERYGIGNPGNLLYDLPDLTVAEVDENIAQIARAGAYAPLAATRFFLNYGSPYHDRFFGSEPAGLPDRNYRAWRLLLPPAVEATLYLTEREFEPEVPGMADAVLRLVEACRVWRQRYDSAKAGGVRWLLERRPVPTAPERWEVVDHRFGEPIVHLLTPLQATLLQHFEVRRPLASASIALPELDPVDLEQTLGELVALDLLVREGRDALSLPIGPLTGSQE